MVAHDVGSAIRGPERGDIYFGTGKAAERTAGSVRHPGNLFVFLANSNTAAPAKEAPGPGSGRR
jgi:membrane-bound lytic murein transglycosylase A